MVSPVATDSSSSSTPETLSWREWLEECGPKLLLFARQQTRNSQDAEDVLQESLVKLAKKVNDNTFTGGQNGWLPFIYTSIRRGAIDLGRKNDRRGRREDKAYVASEIESGGVDDPWFGAFDAQDELGQQLESALKDLPPKFAEVISLKVWGELTFAEIGENLGISQNTAASRYRYGLEALKKKLSGARNRGDIEL